MSTTLPKSAVGDHTPAAGVLLRLFWMGLGSLALVAVAGSLWARAGEGGLVLSVVYWVTVGLISAARYADIARYQGQTIDLAPADLGHWRRHTLGLLMGALPVWAVAFLAGQ